jgi:hypothetical protein
MENYETKDAGLANWKRSLMAAKLTATRLSTESHPSAYITMTTTEQRIAESLCKRFPNNRVAPEHFGELLTQYAESGLSPPHLVADIESADEGKLWSYLWEAMLYRHIRSQGYSLRNRVNASGQHGPDFGIDHQGRTIWIEAVVPSPEGIPTEWLEPPRKGDYRVKTMPHEQMLLRCTSVIADKRKKFAKDRAKGIVGASDCAVIAVNICRLSDLDSDGNGISQLPLVMEAVFPIGPLAVRMMREGKPDGPMQHTPRFAIRKINASNVPTGTFLDPCFENVSALVQGHQKHMFQEPLVLSTVHNPLTSNPLPTGLFNAYQEFVAEEQGEEYHIRKLTTNG